MPAPLSDVLSGSAASSRRALSTSPPRSFISSSSSSVLGLVGQAAATGATAATLNASDHRQHPDWTATRRSPLQLAPLSLPQNGSLSGLGLGFPNPRIPPTPDDYLSPPWSVGRRVYSDGKPSPNDSDHTTFPFGAHDGVGGVGGNDRVEVRSNSSASQTAMDNIDDIQENDMNGVSRRPRILMDAKQTAHLNALWEKTYFPTTAEREQLAQVAKLTPRQVQVWFQNQRQKQRRVLNDPAASTEEKAKLADLRHSPRTRRKMSLQAARMSNNDYIEYGLTPMSPGAPSPISPVRNHPYGHHLQQLPYSRYTSAVSSREYVPPKATISRLSSKPHDERDVYRMSIEPYRHHHLDRRSTVAGWLGEHSPPLTTSSSTPQPTRKRFDDHDDDLPRLRNFPEHGLPSPPVLADRDLFRLPPLSSLALPPPVARHADYSVPSLRRPSNFSMLLNAT